MRKLRFILVIFLPFFVFGQFTEQFSDGNFTESPTWEGDVDNFIVNNELQLQSNASATSVSTLFTPSEAIDNAVWECWVKITYPTSANNYASVYLISDRVDISDGCNAYYVKIGGTNDEVALFLQQGARHTKIIDGIDRRVDGNPVELYIKVTRDDTGNFELYSKLSSEEEYYFEGAVQNATLTQSSYFGVLFSNTGTTGQRYFFDDIFVAGDKAIDVEPPVWNSVLVEEPNKLLLEFSESVNADNAFFEVDNGIGVPNLVNSLSGRTSLELKFFNNFERGIIYTLKITGLIDLAGNELAENTKAFGIAEAIDFGDLLFNEVMFENPENSLEYIELINASDKILDISEFVLTTRRADGALNTGVRVPEKTLLLPNACVAFCSDAQFVRDYHFCPAESNIVETASWTTLNNQEATLVLTDSERDFIFDELTYSTKWHHPLIRNAKGVALERISPLLPTQNADSWHSASSETNYGTPGYRNSQFREINSNTLEEKWVWIEPEAFSPDNDGIDDICFIYYKTDEVGYVANVAIFNASGAKVCQLASNAVLSTEGYFIWDGKTDKGQNANVGIYVLYFEKFHVGSGKRKQVKLPLVVSAR